MAGAIYCPLSPQDPSERLHTLLQETKSPLVLIHVMTKDKFKDDRFTFDIDATVNSIDALNDIDIDHLSSIMVTPESIAYVIFTSGSTGTPKAVSLQSCFSTRDTNAVLFTGSSTSSKFY